MQEFIRSSRNVTLVLLEIFAATPVIVEEENNALNKRRAEKHKLSRSIR